jgi:diguanylate cyclase (GGDEF)-like protein/PAS domain S-box-containing protein
MKNWDPAFWQDLLDNLYDGVYYVNRQRHIVFWNKAAARLTGFSAQEVIGKSCKDNLLRHINEEGLNLCETGCPLVATLQDGKPHRANVYLHHKDGHRVPVAVRVAPIQGRTGEIVGAVEIFSDNREHLAALERVKLLENLAFLDPLTGLANRRYVEQFLEARFNEFTRFHWPFGVIMADVDFFKSINDTFGHEIGDQILKMVAATLAQNCRSFDLVGRWGGEEFLLIICHLAAAETLTEVAQRLRRLVEHSWIQVNEDKIRVTLSMGASMARLGDTMQSIIHRADILLYRSKAAGRNQVMSD